MFHTEPLAYRMRPERIEEVVGQDEIVGVDTPLYKMIQKGHVPSMLLYGEPGTGKTSLAFAISGSTNKEFYAINATTAGKKDVENIINEARMTGDAILFIDEIHRFNKSQQDSLLKALEQGVITLIGATTENPFHSVNHAIRSRCGQIKQLKPLTKEAIIELLNRALSDQEKGLGSLNVHIDDSLIELISDTTGDGRTALSLLEDIVYASDETEDGIQVTKETVQYCIRNKGFSHDNKGDIYYNLLSGLQKSIRGSDADAALYYLARLLEGGDLEAISRRLLVIAYEDIGLANPQLCARVLPAIQSVERLGLPEGRIPLSVVAVELSLSPKSNTAYKALDKAIKHVQKGVTGDIPVHLKDAHYQGAKELGHGLEYKYPHNYPNSWVYQEYLPESIRNMNYYQPKELGEEKRYKNVYEKLDHLRQESRKKQS
ncbi:replication-associated recombination protein A [Tenuibacillus multivorans]|uniref:Putative ATPase n=1 Tax=Tenuibacillus multivorans TaxID=237069 RepID=A0A1G9ZI35_9BACI|nr:replication-associated recombination protein A [Tenuibacillus multivorans]GEL77490.1 putative AAA domain-containing protein YrvN [Tenuibacillus multivorans]SDN21018.1 putative ATPase [Tenuibacillus multivorans]